MYALISYKQLPRLIRCPSVDRKIQQRAVYCDAAAQLLSYGERNIPPHRNSVATSRRYDAQKHQVRLYRQ